MIRINGEIGNDTNKVGVIDCVKINLGLHYRFIAFIDKRGLCF